MREREEFEGENIVIYQASAGSGKTYQIALNYLKLLKRFHPKPTEELSTKASPLPGFKDLVAITFTNKAVFEMKERIISFLREIALDSEKGRHISLETGIEKEEADWLLDEIFLNYDYFEVNTIDSFLLKFFRSLAYEFDLHPNFDVRTYLDPTLLEKALFNLYLRSQQDENIKNLLEEFINFHINEEKKLKINFKRTLVSQLEDFIEALTYDDKLSSALDVKDQKYEDTKVSKKGRLYFQLFNLLKDELEKILLEVGIVYMGYWKEKLAQSIRSDYLPWIYVKLGKIKAFIIDEFQDTDRLQWISLYPLIEELISDGRTFIVAGDLKQSIYRWKGADPTLLEQIKENFKDYNISIKTLDKNFRSGSSIVKFNNNFFKVLTNSSLKSYVLERIIKEKNNSNKKNEELIKRAEEQLQKLFDNIEQECHKNFDGKVYIHWLVFNNKLDEKTLFERIVEVIIDIIKSSDRGEFTILCRENEEVAKISNYLTRHGFKVVGSSFLKLKESHLVNGLIAFIKLFYGQEVELSLATILLEFFGKEGEEILKKYGKFKKTGERNFKLLDYIKFYHSDFWNKHFREVLEIGAKLNLYQFITYLVDKYQLEKKFPSEMAYLHKFLSLLLEFLKRGRDLEDFFNSLNSLLDEDVDIVYNKETIKVMTIHASKGLEFDRVILPLNFSFDRYNIKSGFLITEEGIFKGNIEEFPEDIKEHYLAMKILFKLEFLSLLYVGFTRAITNLHLIVPIITQKFSFSDLQSISIEISDQKDLANLPLSAEIFIKTFYTMKDILCLNKGFDFSVEEILIPCN